LGTSVIWRDGAAYPFQLRRRATPRPTELSARSASGLLCGGRRRRPLPRRPRDGYWGGLWFWVGLVGVM